MSNQASTLASTSSRNSARTAATRRERSGARSDSQASGDDSDALFEELEAGLDEDPDLGGFREKRMQELQQQFERARRMQDGDYGRVSEVKIEKDLISKTAKEKRCVVHFFHRDFRRCKIMDSHLETLASKHLDTLFLRADVANVPFLVAKLAIKTLPCVIGFVNGTTKMKIVGFEELPGGDNFTTASLERGMQECGVLSTEASNPWASAKSRSQSDDAGRNIRRGANADDEELDIDD